LTKTPLPPFADTVAAPELESKRASELCTKETPFPVLPEIVQEISRSAE